MKRILLISCLSLTVLMAWKLWFGGRDTLVRDEELRRSGATALSSSGDGDKHSLTMQETNASVPWSRAGHPAKVVDAPSVATVAGTAGDELKASDLATKLGLSGKTRERLMPLLIRHAEKERLATRELLDQQTSSNDPEFLRALVQRAGLGLTDSELRNQLDADQLRVLDEFDAAREHNVLNVLANREFDSWKHSLDFGESEQAAFEVFYHHWQRRMESASHQSVTTAEMAKLASEEDTRMMEQLTSILPPDEAEKIRIIREAAEDPALQKPPFRE